jgi:predicted ATP-dependent endonuclease of OLD family
VIFDKLVIKNFRSFGPQGQVIQFHDDVNFYSLVGQNGSGKTNVLDALALVLENYRSEWGERKLTQSDFFQERLFDESKKPIILTIELYFKGDHCKLENTTKFITGSTHTTVRGLRFMAKIREKGEERGQIDWDNYCFDDKGKSIGDKTKIWSKPEPQLDTGDIIAEKASSVRKAKEILNVIPKSYYLDIEALKGFMKISGYAPVARLFDFYRSNLIRDKTKLDNVRHWFEQLIPLLKTETLDSIEKRLGSNVSRYLGFAADAVGVAFAPVDIEDILKDILELKLREQGGMLLPWSKHGSGYLSLLRLAVLETLKELREMEPMILLIEEPEIYLHPPLQRHFYRVIKDLADQGYQIFYTTHASGFVSLLDYKSVIRLSKKKEETQIHQVLDPIDFAGLRGTEAELLSKGNTEIFFCNKALIAEGEAETVGLRIVLQKSNVDLDLGSVFIVNCGGRNNLMKYLTLCRFLGIPFFVEYDTDDGEAETAQIVKEIRETTNQDTQISFEFSKSFDIELGLSRDTSKKLQVTEKLEPSTIDQIFSTYAELKECTERILKFLSS